MWCTSGKVWSYHLFQFWVLSFQQNLKCNWWVEAPSLLPPACQVVDVKYQISSHKVQSPHQSHPSQPSPPHQSLQLKLFQTFPRPWQWAAMAGRGGDVYSSDKCRNISASQTWRWWIKSISQDAAVLIFILGTSLSHEIAGSFVVREDRVGDYD